MLQKTKVHPDAGWLSDSTRFSRYLDTKPAPADQLTICNHVAAFIYKRNAVERNFFNQSFEDYFVFLSSVQNRLWFSCYKLDFDRVGKNRYRKIVTILCFNLCWHCWILNLGPSCTRVSSAPNDGFYYLLIFYFPIMSHLIITVYIFAHTNPDIRAIVFSTLVNVER